MIGETHTTFQRTANKMLLKVLTELYKPRLPR